MNEIRVRKVMRRLGSEKTDLLLRLAVETRAQGEIRVAALRILRHRPESAAKRFVESVDGAAEPDVRRDLASRSLERTP
jgi:hypothetical protein